MTPNQADPPGKFVGGGLRANGQSANSARALTPFEKKYNFRTGDNVRGRAMLVRKIATAILESEDYVESLERRIKADELPPAVETMLWHYAYGKPVDKIELSRGTDAQAETADLVSPELQERARLVMEQLAELRARSQAVDVEAAEVKP